ncbi:MAG: methyltransferase domain-containing protein [Myxococcota bacterium]
MSSTIELNTKKDFWDGPGGAKWVASQALMDRILEPFATAVLDDAQLPSEGTLVDVGCGCGGSTLMAARRQPGLSVIGVDVSSAMLERARERARDEGLDIRFEHADAATARPAPGVDRIISRFGVMFFADLVAAFRNMRQWLKPGGRLVAAVWNPLEDNPWMLDLFETLKPHVDVSLPTPGGPGPFSLGDLATTGELLSEAGFVSVAQYPMGLPMRIPGPIEDAIRFQLERTLVAEALEGASPEQREAVHGAIRAYVEARHDGNALTLAASARLIDAGIE